MLNARSSTPAITFVLVLSTLSSSCLFQKKPKPFTPPAPEVQPAIPSAPPVVASPPPRIAGNPSEAMPETPTTIPEIPAPAAPKPQPRRVAPPPTSPKPAVTTPPTEQPPPPKLGPLYSPDELRQYNRAIDESLGRVKRALDSLSRKNLNPDQQADVNRIMIFQRQAEQAREAQDLLTAKSLAERADLLAQDLLGRVP